MGLARKRLGEERQRDSEGKGMSKVINRLSLVCVSESRTLVSSL